MIRSAIIRLLGGTPPPEKTCRRRGPLPGGGYQPQPRCGKCEECLTRRPFPSAIPRRPPKGDVMEVLGCPRPPEDHWEVKMTLRYRSKPPAELTVNITVPIGIDPTAAIKETVVSLAALTDVIDCQITNTRTTTTYPPKERRHG